MEFIKTKRHEMEAYMPPLTKTADFDEFWSKTLEQAHANPLNPSRTLYDYPGEYAKVYDIRYNGFDQTQIHGWLILPNFSTQSKFPCLIHYHGFRGNRGYPHNYAHWVTAGVAVLAVDCRDQSGETGTVAHFSSGYSHNVMCRGINDPQEYYYRAVYMDCLKAIDFVESQPEIDSDKIILEGMSQGGAIVSAVSALDDRPFIALADVPSNSNIEKRVENAAGGFESITEYLKQHPDRIDMALNTLSYFDTMNLADRINCPTFASVALRDQVCPAKLYYATYNRLTCEKEIKIYPFNGHEGGGAYHEQLKMRWVKTMLQRF